MPGDPGNNDSCTLTKTELCEWFDDVHLNIVVIRFSLSTLPRFSLTSAPYSHSLPLSRLSRPAASSSKPEGPPVQRRAGSELGAGVPEQRHEAGGLPGAVQIVSWILLLASLRGVARGAGGQPLGLASWQD